MQANLFDNGLNIADISVISGERVFGKTVDCRLSGRSLCGILYVRSGEARFSSEGEGTLTVKEKEVAFIPRHKKYEMKYTASVTDFAVINFSLFDNSGAEISPVGKICVLTEDDGTGKIAEVIKNLENCSATKTEGTFFRKKEQAYRLFGLLYEFFPLSDQSGECRKISDSLRVLKERYLENLPITQIAAVSHVSVNYFRRLFQRQFGMSPLKYRNLLRIERAKELLIDGSFTVAEVAYASGFENVGYFCRYYRQITGESPSGTKRKKL